MPDNNDITRVDFWTVFRRGQNGSLITNVPLRIGTSRFEEDTTIDRGSLLGGIDFHKQIDRYLAVTITSSGLYIFRGVYLPE